MHHQMVADEVKLIAIQTRFGGAIQSLAKLTIENKIAESLAFHDVFQSLRHAHTEKAGSGKGILAVVQQDGGF
jgi:hypothetical protein